MLSKKPMSFSELLEALGVSGSFLTYHLENLGELVTKIDDGRYKLSSFGEAAMSTMTKVEDIPTTTSTKTKRIVNRSVAVALGLICIILAASLVGTFAYYAPLINDRNNTISSLNTRISDQNGAISSLERQESNLTSQLDQDYANLSQLKEFVTNLQKLLNATFVSVGDITANLSAWVNKTVVVEGNMGYGVWDVPAFLHEISNYLLSSNGASIGVDYHDSYNSAPSVTPIPVNTSISVYALENGSYVLFPANASSTGVPPYYGKNVLVLGTVKVAWGITGIIYGNGTIVNAFTPFVGFIEAESIIVV